MVTNMFTHFAQKYFGDQMTIANLFNYSHFFLNFFTVLFSIYQTLEMYFFFYNVKSVILIPQTMFHTSV